jgi:hypothetical protein
VAGDPTPILVTNTSMYARTGSTIMTDVIVCYYESNGGKTDLSVHRTLEGAEAHLATICRERWADMMDNAPMPDTDIAVIKAYFEEADNSGGDRCWIRSVTLAD